MKDSLSKLFITVGLASSLYAAVPVAPVVNKPASRRMIAQYLDFSTYLGGGMDDNGMDTRVDLNGNIYVTGSRPSVRGEDYDAYVAKYSAAGRLLWSANVGGDCNDSGRGIAV